MDSRRHVAIDPENLRGLRLVVGHGREGRKSELAEPAISATEATCVTLVDFA